MLYALSNLAVAYALLVFVGGMDPRSAPHVSIAASGFALWSLQIARAVTKLRASPSSS